MEKNCRLLLYFDKNTILSDIKDSCERFIKEITEETKLQFSPFRYTLKIDVMDLFDKFPDLGDYLLKEPLKWQRCTNDVILACLQALNKDSLPIESAQVASNLRLTNLSNILLKPNPHNYGGLTSFQGLLSQISNLTSYVYHSVWSCPEDCEGSEIILHYLPKVPPKCYTCRSILYENSGWRRCGDQVNATFKLDNNFLSKKFTIVDDLIPKLKLGSKYLITAVILKKITVVWNIEEMIQLKAPWTYHMSNDVEELFKACDGLPWKFIYCLSSSIGITVCPINCFLHLKITLLLSLTSIKANSLSTSNIIHVLVAGNDTGHVGALMAEAANLAERSIALGPLTNVSTALVASSGGVCYMPLPLYTYNQKQTSFMLSAIESGEIATDPFGVKLGTAVWAQGKDFKKIVLYNIASIFGTLSRGDNGEYNDDISEHILQNAIDPQSASKEEKQALRDITLHIDLVAGIDVSLNDLTEELLKRYFLAARKERSGGVSIGSMGSLVASCLTCARLCRRSVTKIEDAIFAIWLHACGCPEPRFVPEEYLQTPADVKKFGKVIEGFKCWLEEFIGCMISYL